MSGGKFNVKPINLACFYFSYVLLVEFRLWVKKYKLSLARFGVFLSR